MIRNGRLSEAVAVILAAIALVVYFTYPIALKPGSYGRVDSGDGQFAIWNVAWVAHAVLSPDVDVFDANIFHPHRNTLAYSEANLGAGLLAVPGYLATGNAYVAHNSAFLIGLMFSFLGMYALARGVSGSRPGAVVAAVVFTFCPFLFAHTAHIQLLMTGPFPFVLLAMHRFVDAPGIRRAAVLGLSIAIQALFCAYYGVLAGLVVGAGILFFAVSRGFWKRPSWWGLSVLAAAVSVAAVLPLFLPYLQLQTETGFGRRLEEARSYSADWRAYFASSAWLHDWMLKYLGRWNEVLFPGFAALTFGATGLAVGLKRRWNAHLPLHTREMTWFYLVVGALAFWSSLGPDAGLYSVLYYVLPVFSLLRAPARFGLAVSFALAMLSAIGVAAIVSAQPARRRMWVAAAAIGCAVLDLSITMPTRRVGEFPRAYELLAKARPGAVVEFPFWYRPQAHYRHSAYMLNSTVHWQPLINGYSDFIPVDFREIAFPLASFPNPEGFAILRERHARYAVFHLGQYDSRTRESLLRRLQAYELYLRSIIKEGDVWLFEIMQWPETHPDLSRLTDGQDGAAR
jgi:hypothetical protein